MIAPPILSRPASVWTYRILWLVAILLVAAMPMVIVARGDVWLGSARFAGTDRLTHPLIVLGGNVTLQNGGDAPLIVLGGDVVANGALTDDLVTVGGNVYLDEHAVVSGTLLTLAGQAYRAPGARVDGISSASLRTWSDYPSTNRPAERVDLIGQVRLGLAAGLGLLLLCLVVAALLPWSIVVTAATTRYMPIRSALAALTGVVAVPLLALPLVLSLIGLPLALLLGMGAAVVWLVGLTAAGLLVGRWILDGDPRTHGYLRVVLVGLAPILLALAIPVLGPLLVGAIGFWGAGARMVSFVEKERAVGAMEAIARSR